MKRIFQFFIVAMVSLMIASSSWAFIAGHDIQGTGPDTWRTADAPFAAGALLPFAVPYSASFREANFNFPVVGPVNIPNNEMVSLAPNGVGDLLIFPLYAAVDNFATKITVINTAANQSTVAKVVVREGNQSNEVLDFYIYLSPADVWVGYVYYNAAANQVRVYSDDDSILHPTSRAWANEVAFDQPVVDNDDNWLGYITVFNVATYDAQSNTNRINNGDDPLGLNVPGTVKQAIHDWFWGFNSSDNLILGQYRAGVFDAQLPNIAFGQPGKNRNILAGYVDLTIGNNTPPFTGGNDAAASMQAVALQDYNVSHRPARTLEMAIWQASDNAPVTAFNYTNLDEVEAVLAKSRAMLPFEFGNGRQSIHFFTFPTKYSQGNLVNAVTGNRIPRSTIFQTHGALMQDFQCLGYANTAWDLQENAVQLNVSPFTAEFCREVDLVDTYHLDSIFTPFFPDMGWIDYRFNDANTNAPYLTFLQTPAFPFFALPADGAVGSLLVAAGIPVIPTSLTLDNAGSMTLTAGATGDTFGIVTSVGGFTGPTPEAAVIEDNKLKDSASGSSYGGPGDANTATK